MVAAPQFCSNQYSDPGSPARRLRDLCVSGVVRDRLLLLLLCCAAFFVHNTVLPADIMESRNLVSAREMVLDGHWLLPTLNGELRLEKPPLPTWLTALTWYILPSSVALARGVAGLFGLLLLLCFYDTVRLLHDRRVALFSSLVLLTCYNVVLQGRTASWDIYCHAFVVASFLPLLRALRGEHVWMNWLIAGLLLGLSFMSKGPISLYGLWLPFCVAIGAAARKELRMNWWPMLTGVIVCVVVGGWWYVYVQCLSADAMQAVMEKETGNWTGYNTRPWWYYWRFWLESGVWAPVSLLALLYPLWQWCRGRHVSRQLLLPWLWTMVGVVLLSLFPEKKMRYLLPVMMPLSMLVGEWLCGAGGWLGRKWRVGRVCMRHAGWIVGAVVSLFFVVEVALFPLVGSLFGNPERRSLSIAREDVRLNGVPFLHDSSQTPRPEIMWATGGLIDKADFSCCDSIVSCLPCAVLTHEPAAEVLPRALWERVDSLHIGRFDDNARPPSYTRRYSRTFIYYVTLLTPKL